MIQLNRILAPTDFSQFSAEAMKYACAFVERFGSDLHVVHVSTIDTEFGPQYLPDYIEQLQQEEDKALAAVPDVGWAEGQSVVRTRVSGTPFLEIIRYAKQNDIDMIVMGTHGLSGLAQMLMGSVAEKVVRKSPCPVLTVRPEGHQFVMP